MVLVLTVARLLWRMAASAAAAARRGHALGARARAGRPLGAAGPAARHAGQRLADEFGRRRQRLLVRRPAAARPGAARSRPFRSAAHRALRAVAMPDRGRGAARRRGACITMCCAATASSAACGLPGETDAPLADRSPPCCSPCLRLSLRSRRTAGCMDDRPARQLAHLHRHPDRRLRQRTVSCLERHYRARSGGARRGAHRHRHPDAGDDHRQSGRRLADEGSKLPRRPEISRSALRRQHRRRVGRRPLRGARQAHDPRCHARCRAALHPGHRRQSRAARRACAPPPAAG